MKKTIGIFLIALSGFTALPAMALVNLVTVRFVCPSVSGGATERLTNYGDFIRGMGEENIGSNKTLPMFSCVPSAGVPLDLSTGGYSNAGTQYNPHNGKVTCLFASSLGNAPFNVSFVAANMKRGWVDKSGIRTLTIQVVEN